MRVLFRCRLRPCSEPCAPGIRCADSGIQVLRSPEPSARCGSIYDLATPPGVTPPDVADSNRSEGGPTPSFQKEHFSRDPGARHSLSRGATADRGAEDSRLETGNGY